ncbi:MAG: hypothetical protein OEM67_13030 [Thermoleophilia bacterium]|nr:hypothetical protein [Thermoleophilia bacterium]
MNDLLKFALLFIVAVLVLALAFRLIVGFFLGLLVPLILIIAIAVGAYWLLFSPDDEK